MVLDPIIRRARIPGAAALVLRGDRIIAQGAAGVRKRGSNVSVSIDDQFEICSCSKAMTATLVARLIEQRKLRWDTTLAELLSNSVPHLHPAWQHVTVSQALSHHAGMKDHLVLFVRTALWSSGEPSALRLRYVTKILSHPPDYRPGTTFVYDSTGYLVVATALEKITGRSWEDLMRRELFEPLGLSTAGFGPPGTPGQLDQPWGHGVHRWFSIPVWGGGLTPFDPGSRSADLAPVAAPGGLVHMSMGDWAKFATLHLRGDAANPLPVAAFLQPGSFVALHQATNNDYTTGGWFTGARPWAKGSRPGDTGRVLFHQGDNGRWNCVIWLAPEIDFAVLVACNRASMWKSVDEIAGALVKEFASPPDR
jgi:CubicO group peptidase (beta-lactamase class C family)